MILALVLVGSDIVFGFQFFVLSISVAVLLIVGVLVAQQNRWFGEAVVIDIWREVGAWFTFLSMASIFFIKSLLRQR